MWFYFLLGIIQGVLEWLPISSQGVLALLAHFLKPEVNPIDLALFLHFGTLFAALFYFRQDWKEVLILKNRELAIFLIIATLISLVVGFSLYQFIRNLVVGNSLLLLTGFGLLFTAYFQKRKKFLAISFNKLAVISGFLQGMAVIPGFSRSAATIFGLSLAKSSPSEILKISYIMSVPVVLASTLYLSFTRPVLIFEAWPALIPSFLVGLLTLDILLRFSQKINFFKFALFFSLLCFLGAILGFLL